MMGTYFVEVHVSLDGVCFCFCQKPTRRAWSLTSVLCKVYFIYCVFCFVLFLRSLFNTEGELETSEISSNEFTNRLEFFRC